MTVGFVGAGRMGTPMVRRLVESGFDVRVLGRTDAKRSAAMDLGAHAVTSVSEAGRDVDAVVVCVFTDEQVREVCLDGGLIEAMSPGSVLILHTTGSPRTAQTIADRAVSHGVEVVDAPVSGGPHDIAAGRVTLFVGGSENAVSRVTPMLSSYADPILHVGPVGAGQKVKLINNTLFAANIGLVSEAVRLGSELGVPETALLNAVQHGSGTSRALSSMAAAGSAATFRAAVGEFIAKDVAVIRQTADDLGADLGLLDDAVDTALN